MKQKLQKFWRHKEWQDFSNKVKRRDNFQCLQCDRTENEVILQVHHEVYRADKKPWEYALSDCRTLCKGCHSKHHNLIEPSNGWYLIGVDDLGALEGVCERNNCGTEIRYEHITYHPNWGYKIVGSTCIDHLTQQDKLLSSDILKMYKQISKFISKSIWEVGFTKKNKRYIETKFKYHYIRIYGDEKKYSFQLIIKEIGNKWYEYKDFIPVYNKSLEEVKELAYIALKGTISEDTKEVELLRNIYRNIK
jgi:hypothetical protein